MASNMSLLFVYVFDFLRNLIREYLWKTRIFSISSSPSQQNHLIQPQPQFNDDILSEILFRLPSKSLMRFKCVSKQCNSIIRNPVFAQAHSSHGGGYRGLLLSRVKHDFDTGYYTKTFYTIDNNNLQVCHQLSLKHDDFIYNGFGISGYDYLHHTDIVKGMIGYYWHIGPAKFTLCNIATHEMLDIPIITPSGINKFYIGFDPVNLVYKILRYYSDIGDCSDYYNEICTIGEGGGNDLSWRSLEPPPVLGHSFQSVCIDGIIYFWAGWFPNDLPMIAFDLKTETFKSIPVPQSANDFVITHSETLEVVEIGGRPALLYLPFPSPVGSPGGPTDYLSIWMLRNNEDIWTEQQRVDIQLEMGVLFAYGCTLPTGEMLLAEADDMCNWWTKDPIKNYKYDHLQKEVENWISISNDHSSSFGCNDDYMEICYHEENIMRLAA